MIYMKIITQINPAKISATNVYVRGWVFSRISIKHIYVVYKFMYNCFCILFFQENLMLLLGIMLYSIYPVQNIEEIDTPYTQDTTWRKTLNL